MRLSSLCLVGLTVVLGGCFYQRSDRTFSDATLRVERHASITPAGRTSEEKVSGPSDYNVCLARNEGLPDRVKLCQAEAWAGRPGQLPRCGMGYWGSYGCALEIASKP